MTRSPRTGAPAAMRVYQLAALTIGAGIAVSPTRSASICSVPTDVPDSFIQNITWSTVGWAARPIADESIGQACRRMRSITPTATP